MLRRPPRCTRTDTLFPYTTLFRSITDRLRVIEHRRSGQGSNFVFIQPGDIDVNIERTRIAADAQHLQINSPVHLRIDTRGVDAGEIERGCLDLLQTDETADRKSTRLNSSH